MIANSMTAAASQTPCHLRSFGRMFWKEYRQQRTLWLAVLVAGMVVQLVLRMLLPAGTEMVKVLWVAPLAIALFYLPGSAAMLFALEREERTSDWLLSLSASPRGTLSAKYGFVAVSTLAMILATWLWAVVLLVGLPYPALDELFPPAYPPETTTAWRVTVVGVTWIFAALGILAWGALGSLTSRRVVVAVPVGLVWWMFMTLVPLALIAVLFDNQVGSWRGGLEGTVIWVSFVAVLVADVWLGWRWCRGRYVDAAWIDEWNERVHERLRWGGERTSRIPVVVESEFSGWRAWQRLIWQERRRESFHSALLWIGCAVGVLLAFYSWARGDSITIGVLPLVTPLPLAMGLLGFRGDAAGRQLRFLSNTGTSPALIWLAKQVVWLPRACWIPAVVFTVSMLAELAFIPRPAAEIRLVQYGEVVSENRWEGINHPLRAMWLDVWRRPDIVLWFGVLTYGAGQLAAMLIRQTVVAVAVGFVFGGLLTGWLWGMWSLEVPLWWSAGGLVVWLWMLTWSAAPSWLLDWRSWSEWWRLVAGLVLPPLLLAGAVTLHRAVEVPGFGPASQTLFSWLYPREYQRREPDFKLRDTRADDGLLAELARQRRVESPDDAAAAQTLMSVMGGFQTVRMFREQIEMKEGHTGTNRTKAETEFPLAQTSTDGDLPADALLANREQRAIDAFWAANESGLKDMVAIAQRERCGRLRRLMSPGAADQWLLPQQVLLLEAAWLRTEESRLDEALTYLCASLRLATFWADGGGIWSRWKDGLDQQGHTLRAVVDWANHPAQSSRSLLAGLERVNAELTRFSSVTEAVVAQYLQDSERLQGVITRRSRTSFSPLSPQEALRAESASLLPWEVVRIRRVMEQQLVWRFHAYGSLMDWMSRPGMDASRLFGELTARDPDLAADDRARRSSLLAFMTRDALDPEILRLAVNRESTVRQARLALALLAWKHDHGAWPETLGHLMEYRTSRPESEDAQEPPPLLNSLAFPAITLQDPWNGALFEYNGIVLNNPRDLRGDFVLLTSVGPDQQRTVLVDKGRGGDWQVKTFPDRGGSGPTIFTPCAVIARDNRLSLRVP